MTDDVQIGIGIKAGDRSGLDLIKGTAASLEDARKAIKEAQAAGGLYKIVADSAVAGVNNLTNRAAALANQLYEAESALAKFKDTDPGFTQKTAEVEALRKALKGVSDDANNVWNRVNRPTPAAGGGGVSAGGGAGSDLIGRGDSSLSAFAGLIGNFVGGEQVARLATIGADLLNVTDQFGRLGDALTGAPGLIGKVASSGAALGAPLGATAAGLGAILAVAAPLVIAIGGIVAILAEVQRGANEAAAAAEKYAKALDRQIKIDREIADFLESGDVEGAKKRYEELLKNQTDANAQLTYLYNEKARIDKEYTELGATLNANARSALGSEGQKIQEEIDRVYNDSFVPLTEAVDEFGAVLDQIAAAADQKAILDAQVEALQQRAQIETQLASIIRAGNDGAITDRRQAIEDELRALQATIPELTALADESETAADALDSAKTRQRQLTNELFLYSDTALGAAAAQAEVNRQNAALLAGYEAQIQTLIQVGGLIKSANTDSLDQRLEAIQIERDAINSQLPAIRELAATSADAADKVKQYEERLTALNDEFGQLSAARPEVRVAEITKALNEIEKAELDTNRRIEDIRRAGLAKIVDIEQSATEARAAASARRAESLIKAANAENKAVSDTNTAYMTSERKAWDKFYSDQLKAELKGQKERLRIIEDTNNALLEAEKANDVIAFIQANRQGQQALDRQQEQAEESRNEAIAAFNAERKERELQHQERLEQIRAQASEARAAADAQYKADLQAAEDNRKRQLESAKAAQEELIAAEEAGLVARVAAIQNTYNLEQGLIDEVFNRRRSRYDEDDKLVNERLDLALARHAEDLRLKAEQEIRENQRAVKSKSDTETRAAALVASTLQSNFLSAVSAIQSGLSGFISNLRGQLQSQVAAASTASRATSYNGQVYLNGNAVNVGTSGMRAVAFANEGIVTAANGPTLALLGEKLNPGQIEAVVKFNPSEGLPSKLGGSTSINVGSVSVSGGMGRNEVISMLQDGFIELLDGINRARNGES